MNSSIGKWIKSKIIIHKCSRGIWDKIFAANLNTGNQTCHPGAPFVPRGHLFMPRGHLFMTGAPTGSHKRGTLSSQ